MHSPHVLEGSLHTLIHSVGGPHNVVTCSTGGSSTGVAIRLCTAKEGLLCSSVLTLLCTTQDAASCHRVPAPLPFMGA
jgi:hypothetical protein